jgi:hypothetical protein
MANKNDVGEVVKLQEKVTVYATEKCRYIAKGAEIKVHPLLAKKLIKAGKATEKAQK